MFNKIKVKIKKYYYRCLLPDQSFSIISDNCWGGFVSRELGLPYNSPFIGLFLFSPDYIRMLKNLNYYLSQPLTFISASESMYAEEMKSYGTYNKYPIAKLFDIELHFLHYDSNEDAQDKWERRLKRINYNNLIVKFSDRDLATENLIKEFDSLTYARKICLTTDKYRYRTCTKMANTIPSYMDDEWNNFKSTNNVIRFVKKLY